MRNYDLEVPVSKKNYSIKKNNHKCISCGWCKKACINDITVAKMFEYNPEIEPLCINCGWCTNVCPTEAIHEKFDYLKVQKILHNKKDKIVIFNISPSSYVSLEEEFDKSIMHKIPGILKKMGADYVFDLSLATDIYIMSETEELLHRLKKNGPLPQINASCPAWVNYCEIFYPELIPNLSPVKSNNLIASTIIKTSFAKKNKIKKDNIINIIVTPCVTKKAEIRRKKVNNTTWDTDYALTTRELAMLIKEEPINLNYIKDSKYDKELTTNSSTAILYDIPGGITESIIKTINYKKNNRERKLSKELLANLRSTNSLREIEIDVSGKVIKMAICNGMNIAIELIDKVIKKEVYYDYIEITSCKDGCIIGGGNPKITLLNLKEIKEIRTKKLYDLLDNKKLKPCYKNIKEKIPKKIIETMYYDKSSLLRGGSDE